MFRGILNHEGHEDHEDSRPTSGGGNESAHMSAAANAPIPCFSTLGHSPATGSLEGCRKPSHDRCGAAKRKALALHRLMAPRNMG